MRFRTEIQPLLPPFQLSLHKPLLSLGSCFADVMGSRLLQAKFQAMVNPFGTLFHPLPLVQLLQYSMDEHMPPASSYLPFQDRWLNYLLHSSLNAATQEELQATIAASLKQVKHNLLQGQALLLTLGTSFVYELKDPVLTVANCHKQPQQLFHKRLVPAEESFDALERMWLQLKQVNPAQKLVITLSPVRHLKDTLELNSVSKALLRVVCHQLAEKYPEEIYYFPSWELLMDDLRDYRYCKGDLLHPNELAEEYIWDKFAATLLDEEARHFLQEWLPLQQSLRHKPFNPTSAAHRQFLERTLQKLQRLPYPYLVGEEIKKLEEQLQA